MQKKDCHLYIEYRKGNKLVKSKKFDSILEATNEFYRIQDKHLETVYLYVYQWGYTKKLLEI